MRPNNAASQMDISRTRPDAVRVKAVFALPPMSVGVDAKTSLLSVTPFQEGPVLLMLPQCARDA